MIQVALLNVIIWMLPILTVASLIAMFFIIKSAIKQAIKEIKDEEDRI